jgi:hypothetical protein
MIAEKFTDANGVEVQAIQINDVEMLREVRHAEWAENQVRLLTYPAAEPVGLVALEPPFMFGQQIVWGNWLVKGPAGDLEVMADGVFTSKYAAVAV